MGRHGPPVARAISNSCRSNAVNRGPAVGSDAHGVLAVGRRLHGGDADPSMLLVCEAGAGPVSFRSGNSASHACAQCNVRPARRYRLTSRPARDSSARVACR